MSDKDYWINYYKNHQDIGEPSPFAKYVVDNYNEEGTLVELGCGSGRDSVFFAQNNLQVTGVDQCPNVIERLNGLRIPGAHFVKADFSSLPTNSKYDKIYSRFTLHSVGKAEATRTLNWCYDSLNKEGIFLIEVRSVKDELYGVGTQVEKDAWFTDHYRRFIRIDELVAELRDIGFEIVEEVESKGLAPYKNEDPIVIRVIAAK